MLRFRLPFDDSGVGRRGPHLLDDGRILLCEFMMYRVRGLWPDRSYRDRHEMGNHSDLQKIFYFVCPFCLRHCRFQRSLVCLCQWGWCLGECSNGWCSPASFGSIGDSDLTILDYYWSLQTTMADTKSMDNEVNLAMPWMFGWWACHYNPQSSTDLDTFLWTISSNSTCLPLWRLYLDLFSILICFLFRLKFEGCMR